MRLYGKKFARQLMDKRVERKTETRDAVLWDIDWSNHQARVKIQGSNSYVIAHFPRNWAKQPYWLKEGNAVRVLHRSGIRGYVEVIGEGRAIPAPVQGGALPPAAAPSDGVISGLNVLATNPESMAVNVESGWFRLNSNVYYYTSEYAGFMVMNDPPPMSMGSSQIMGQGLTTVDVATAPSAGYYRYDLIAIGEDLTIDYYSGEISSTDPQQPAVPSDHLQLGNYILIRGGVTEVYQYDIGAVFTTRVPAQLDFTLSGSYLSGEYHFSSASGEGAYPNPQMTVTVTVKDQYGQALTPGSPGYDMTLELERGTGTIWSGDTGWSSGEVSQDGLYGPYGFKYQRVEDQTEYSVVLKCTLNVDPEIEASQQIVLIDESGAYIGYQLG